MNMRALDLTATLLGPSQQVHVFTPKSQRLADPHTRHGEQSHQEPVSPGYLHRQQLLELIVCQPLVAAIRERKLEGLARSQRNWPSSPTLKPGGV